MKLIGWSRGKWIIHKRLLLKELLVIAIMSWGYLWLAINLGEILHQVRSGAVFLHLKASSSLKASWDLPHDAIKIQRPIANNRPPWNSFISSQDGFSVGFLRKNSTCLPKTVLSDVLLLLQLSSSVATKIHSSLRILLDSKTLRSALMTRSCSLENPGFGLLGCMQLLHLQAWISLAAGLRMKMTLFGCNVHLVLEDRAPILL